MPDLLLTDLRGGRNGIDSPVELADNQVAEARNIDWEFGPLGGKRRGAINISAGAFDLSVGIAAGHRHVPNGDETQAELWLVLLDSSVVRLTTMGWETVTLDDDITSSPYLVEFSTFNGKLFMAYGSAVDRLHVYDPIVDKVRRVGLAKPSPPTITNTGSGSYAAVERFYRIRIIDFVTPTVIRRSEPSTSVAFTPDGSHAAARVTKPSLPGEGETHWEVEVALSADGPWFVLQGVGQGTPILVATTTSDDSADTLTYFDLLTSESVGQFTLPTSVRYLKTDGNHLLMAGSYSATGLSSRIWNTPALGSADHGDDERIIFTDVLKGFVDLNEKDGGSIVGLSDPIQGTVWAFKYRQTWKLVATGDPTAIYLPKCISRSVGCIFSKTIVTAEDAVGNAIVAYVSHKGPYRVGVSGGIEKIGRDVDDIWFGMNGQVRVNLEASIVVAHGIYHSDRNQLWFYVSRLGNDSPDLKLMLDVRRNIRYDAYGIRGGWAVHDGTSCKAVCSFMFSNTIGATMSRDLKPYIGFLDV